MPSAAPRPAPRCVIVTGAHGMFSAGYDIGEIPDAEFEEQAERARRTPVHRSDRRAGGVPASRRSPSCRATRSAAASSWRWPATCVSPREDISLGMPPARLGLVYSHTGLRRFIDAIGAPRTRELFLLGRHIDAPTALGLGARQPRRPPRASRESASELAGELAGNAPLSQRGNKRVIAALLDAEGARGEGRTGARSSCAAPRSPRQDMREGMRAFAREAPGRTGAGSSRFSRPPGGVT